MIFLADPSNPARSVVITGGDTIDAAIEAERGRRLRLKGRGKPFHYWRERGDAEAPSEEHWCKHCAGYFGVPHDEYTHRPGELCRNLGRYQGNRQCACIDCVVYEAWSFARRGA